MSCVTSVTSGSVAIVVLAEARPRGPCSPAVDTHAAVAGGSVCAAAVGQLGFLCPPDPCAPHACLSCSFIPAGPPSDVLTGCCHPRLVSFSACVSYRAYLQLFSQRRFSGVRPTRHSSRHRYQPGPCNWDVTLPSCVPAPPRPSPVFVHCAHLGGSDA